MRAMDLGSSGASRHRAPFRATGNSATHSSNHRPHTPLDVFLPYMMCVALRACPLNRSAPTMPQVPRAGAHALYLAWLASRRAEHVSSLAACFGALAAGQSESGRAGGRRSNTKAAQRPQFNPIQTSLQAAAACKWHSSVPRPLPRT